MTDMFVDSASLRFGGEARIQCLVNRLREMIEGFGEPVKSAFVKTTGARYMSAFEYSREGLRMSERDVRWMSGF